MNITLPCKTLKTALQSVLPHASTDKLKVPILRGVHVYVHAGNVLFEATDRHTLGMCKVELGGWAAADDASFSVVLPLDDVKAVVKFLGTVPDQINVTVSVGEDDKVTVTAPGCSMSFVAYNGTYPTLRSIVPVVPGSGESLGVVSYDPQLLARFSVSARAFREGKSVPCVTVINPKRAGVSTRAGVSKRAGAATQVTIGGDFLGLIMVARDTEPTVAREGWGSIL